MLDIYLQPGYYRGMEKGKSWYEAIFTSPKKERTVTVRDCNTCPFLYKNGEFPQTICRLVQRSWGMGHYEGGPPSKWCPLRDGPVRIKLVG